jgi:hypothetical protein
LWELGIRTRGKVFGDGLLLAGDYILRGVEFSLERLVTDAVQELGKGTYKMVSKQEGTKSRDEDQEDQVESDIANALPHTGRSHLEVGGEAQGCICIFCKQPLL